MKYETPRLDLIRLSIMNDVIHTSDLGFDDEYTDENFGES